MRVSPLGIFGANYPLKKVTDWAERVFNCRPEAGVDGVAKPRPECFWPQDALELAARLVNPDKTVISA